MTGKGPPSLAYRDLFSRYHDYRRLLVALACRLREDFTCERVSIFLRASGNRFLTIVAQGVEGMTIDVKPGEGIAGKALQQKRSLIVNDPAHDPRSLCRVRDHYTGFRTRCLLAVPGMDVWGRPLGAFMLLNSVKGRFTNGERERLERLTWMIRKIKKIAPRRIRNIWTPQLEEEILDEEGFQG